MATKGYTKTKTELAKLCGGSRPTVDKYLALPDAPVYQPGKGWSIEEWQAHVLKHTESSAIAATLNSDIADLKKWDIYERARKTKIANDAKDRKLIPKAEHESVVREMATECQRVLYTVPTMAPELSGLSVVEMERRLRDRVDMAVKTLSGK